MRKEWEVFIRSNKDRGDDVIKALTDLGAVNYWEYAGNCPDSIYYIRHDGRIGKLLYETEFAQILMDKYTELYLSEKWKDGDIIVENDTNPVYSVFRSKEGNGKFSEYSCVTSDGTIKVIYK